MRKNRWAKRWAEAGLLLAAGAALLLRPEAARAGALRGLAVCGGTLIPALFPFSVLAGALLKMGAAGWLDRPLRPLTRRLFRLPGRCGLPLLTGLLGGYPLGAVTLAELYRSGSLTQTQARRASAFCSSTGPGFILGALGAGILGSLRAGLALWGIHVLSALLTGWLMNLGKPGPGPEASEPALSTGLPLSRALPAAISEAGSAMLRLSATVVFFSVLSALAEETLPADRLPAALVCLLRGGLELTAGCRELAALPRAAALPLGAALLGWGGLCVHFQAADALLAVGLPLGPYLKGKALQALLSLLLGALAVGRTAPGPELLPPWIPAAAAGILLFSVFCGILRKRRWKSRRNVV